MRSKSWIRFALFLVLALFAGLTGPAWLAPECGSRGCPAVESLPQYHPPEPPFVFDGEGRVAGHLSVPYRRVVGLREVPEHFRKGFVAVEDRRFREHGGVDLRAVGRALVQNVRSGGVREGASTITMQLARTLYGPEILEYNPWHRKLVEVRLAHEIEARLTKDRILWLYLNEIYFGGGAYGVEAASRHFFDKSVQDITVSESALLIGLVKAPGRYHPGRHPERARARREVVLDVMAREGVIGRRTAEGAAEMPLGVTSGDGERDDGSYFLAAIQRELRELLPDAERRGGLRIYTALDPELHRAAREELVDQIRTIEDGRHGRYPHPVPDSAAELPPAEGGSSFLQGMVVALDVHTGAVKALVGGRSFDHSSFDRAMQARRQPGSAFKPLVYAEALARGIPPVRRVPTGPVELRRIDGELWTPGDMVDARSVTIREALVRSSNSAAIRVGSALGPEAVVDRAHRMGIESDLPAVPSIFLGAGEVVPAELVAAYAAFGNGGRRLEPHVITRIEDGAGRILWEDEPTQARALDPAAAYIGLDILRDVVDRGTGWRVRQEGVRGPVAGKTGTTNGGKDVWFVGLTPGTVAGVWLGFDYPRTIVDGATGGELAAPVWGRVMAGRRDEEGPGWRAPSGVESVNVDVETGYRAGYWCPDEHVRNELFLSGSEPASTCPIHGPDLRVVDPWPGRSRGSAGQPSTRQRNPGGAARDTLP